MEIAKENGYEKLYENLKENGPENLYKLATTKLFNTKNPRKDLDRIDRVEELARLKTQLEKMKNRKPTG